MHQQLATTHGKDAALAALKKRRENQPTPLDNAALPAGAPMYFYCISCGHVSDTLPEEYLGKPNRLCLECTAMKEMGWLV